MTLPVVSRFKLILEEHRRLRSTLDRIGAMVAHPPGEAEPAVWTAGLADKLCSLKPLLESHFATEEKDGFFEEVQQAWPSSTDLCRQLLSEHADILLRIEDLQAAAAAAASEHQVHALAGRVRALVNDLERHEERENELLFRAVEGGPAALD